MSYASAPAHISLHISNYQPLPYLSHYIPNYRWDLLRTAAHQEKKARFVANSSELEGFGVAKALLLIFLKPVLCKEQKVRYFQLGVMTSINYNSSNVTVKTDRRSRPANRLRSSTIDESRLCHSLLTMMACASGV